MFECECILHVHIYILSLYRGINASYLCQFTDVTECRDVQCNFYMFIYFWWFTHLPNKLKNPGEILEGCKNPFKDVSVRAARSNMWNYLLWLFLVNKEMAVTVVSSSFILSVCNHERYLYPLVSSSLSQLKKRTTMVLFLCLYSQVVQLFPIHPEVLQVPVAPAHISDHSVLLTHVEYKII